MAKDGIRKKEKPAQVLKAGDVIVTHDGVKHWHGATKDSWFEHIAITAGKPEWLKQLMIKRTVNFKTNENRNPLKYILRQQERLFPLRRP